MTAKRHSSSSTKPWRLPVQWYHGPVSDRLIDAHDRPIECMAIRGDLVVTGSHDHGLKVHQISTGTFVRELYNKKYGHKEWVTSVDFVHDGRILSGAMDNKLCLWHKSLVNCKDLVGHSGTLSKVRCHDTSSIGMSASYDTTLKVWDLDAGREIHTLKTVSSHTRPVTEFYWKNALVVSGGRDGMLCVWDVTMGQMLNSMEGHSSMVTSLCTMADHDDNSKVIISGGNDGRVCLWDLRTSQRLQKITAVPGSINDMKLTRPSEYDGSHSSRKLIIGGADNVVRVLDPRMDFAESCLLHGHRDVITSLSATGNLVLSASGNGWVLTHNYESGECLYGVGVCDNTMATYVQAAPPDHFVATGADGNILLFDFDPDHVVVGYEGEEEGLDSRRYM